MENITGVLVGSSLVLLIALIFILAAYRKSVESK
jgi:hypothetical protein